MKLSSNEIHTYFFERLPSSALVLCRNRNPEAWIGTVTVRRHQESAYITTDSVLSASHYLILDYYSFKIFPQFWLVKSTSIIHHNQLRMTKFGSILFLTRKWRQKCSLLQVNAPLTEKTWGQGWVVFVVKIKMANTSLVSRARTTAGTRRNNG